MNLFLGFPNFLLGIDMSIIFSLTAEFIKKFDLIEVTLSDICCKIVYALHIIHFDPFF